MTPVPDHGHASGLAFLPLTVAIALMLALTFVPMLLTRPDGSVHHGATILLAWAMSAGFVRGVGFVPRHPVLRRLFSTAACMVSMGAGIVLLLLAHRQGA